MSLIRSFMPLRRAFLSKVLLRMLLQVWKRKEAISASSLSHCCPPMSPSPLFRRFLNRCGGFMFHMKHELPQHTPPTTQTSYWSPLHWGPFLVAAHQPALPTPKHSQPLFSCVGGLFFPPPQQSGWLHVGSGKTCQGCTTDWCTATEKDPR